MKALLFIGGTAATLYGITVSDVLFYTFAWIMGTAVMSLVFLSIYRHLAVRNFF